jgi:hypothetical protein
MNHLDTIGLKQENPCISVVMPCACAASQLNSIIARFLSENKVFFKRHSCEIILLDSIPHPDHRNSLRQLETLVAGCGACLEYYETDVVGAGAKLREGLRIGAGRYAFFMTDENIIMYDCFANVLKLVEAGFIVSFPYIGCRRHEDGSHPLQYRRQAPVPPMTFPLLEREKLIKLSERIPSHILGDEHWAILAWESGYRVCYSSRHLRYCPIIKIDTVRPDVYEVIPRSVYDEDRMQFLEEWPLDRLEKIHATIIDACRDIMGNSDISFRIVTGPKGGIYIVKIEEDHGLPSAYRELTSESEMKEVAEKDLEAWKQRAPLVFSKMRRQIKESGRKSLRHRIFDMFGV